MTPLPDSSLILVVDDDPLIRMQLRMFLHREGYEIVERNNGKDGLIAFAQLNPDIVLLDAMMPDMDGFECCAQLKKLVEDRHVPILMITGLEDQQSVDRAFEVGAADYVTKPIHWAVLRQRVRRLIQQSQLQQKLEALNAELKRLAAVDDLTQVANRRRFDEYLNHEWRYLMRNQLPLALILCDIDCFKLYNDTYGHQAGDRCLQAVAQVIQNNVRYSTDLVARYGGEEFAVILPNTEASHAVQIAEKLCTVVRALAIPHETSLVRSSITMSLGVATAIPQPDLTPDWLIAQADEALYQAKAAGRDRVVLAPLSCYR
ncbi:diguanylate cyclase domain-containing protein [Oscillatoria sp. FACHB-1407]|uniref:diguanylate cyclase domain-containing protein n=1 Tax=Oscillatoria sp. FACHB-1407 TaxID=2692847 RepID=UPI001F54D553|nr:PleD family two-component system response regulator [Oscillatoria sp. FACHB-1407]